jgi:hypothetical protein
VAPRHRRRRAGHAPSRAEVRGTIDDQASIDKQIRDLLAARRD